MARVRQITLNSIMETQLTNTRGAHTRSLWPLVRRFGRFVLSAGDDLLTGIIGFAMVAGLLLVIVLAASLLGWVAMHCGFPRDILRSDLPPIQVPMAAGFSVAIICGIIAAPLVAVGAAIRWLWRAWKASA